MKVFKKQCGYECSLRNLMCFNQVVQYMLTTRVAWRLQKTWSITCLHQTYWSALPLHNNKIISRKIKLCGHKWSNNWHFNKKIKPQCIFLFERKIGNFKTSLNLCRCQIDRRISKTTSYQMKENHKAIIKTHMCSPIFYQGLSRVKKYLWQ